MNRILIAFLSLPLLAATGPDKPDEGPPPAQAEAAGYAFVRGDTLYSLARWARTSVPALLAANPGIDPTKIEIGDIVRLPAGARDPAPARFRERGDGPGPAADRAAVTRIIVRVRAAPRVEMPPIQPPPPVRPPSPPPRPAPPPPRAHPAPPPAPAPAPANPDEDKPRDGPEGM